MPTSSPAERWSPIFVLTFFAFVVFLFFHLYLRPPKTPENGAEQEAPAELVTPSIGVINPSRGPESAVVTMVEFGDFQCEACRDLSVVMDDVAREHPDAIRIIWKDFPNESLHREATPAAIAARCADAQGAFWPYHDLLFTQINFLSTNIYQTIARSLELDLDAFSRCVNDKTPLPRIQRDFEEGLALSLTATPTLFVNGERYVGALTKEHLLEILTPLLP